MKRGLDIAIFGSSLVSSYWNGAATYYRGLIRALHRRGHRIRFFEPDAFRRQQHRDMADPSWAQVIVYAPNEDAAAACLERARGADVVVKTSGVGVLDEYLEREVLALQGASTAVVFWDVDAPATLWRLETQPDDPFRALVPRYDMVLTYGGGPPVVAAYERFGARRCVPIYNGVDPQTHYPVPARTELDASLSFLGNRLPDREQRVMEFFFKPAALHPAGFFLLAGSGWDENVPELANVHIHGHLYTRDHNAFNSSPLAVLNVCRESMARNGYSPATRVFEAAGAAACIISDRWEGIELFLEPEREVLVAADGAAVADLLCGLSRARARAIGRAARARVLADHTYGDRAALVEALLLGEEPWAGIALSGRSVAATCLSGTTSAHPSLGPPAPDTP